MAVETRKADRLKVKEMVEGWEGRKLPKKITMRTLIEMVMDERNITMAEEGFRE